MKKLLVVTFILITSLCSAQIPKEAFPLTNSLSDLWSKGKTDKAIENSIALYDMYPPMFIDRIHNTLAQRVIGGGTKKIYRYLSELRIQGHEEINTLTFPIYLWSKTVNTTDEEDYVQIIEEIETLLMDSSDYVSKAERYCLLVIQELSAKEAISKDEGERLVRKVIDVLETYPYKYTKVEDKKEGQRRAWHRFMLAYSYDYLYSYFDADTQYLKLASDYSPSIDDKQFSNSYFYDASVLGEDLRTIDFQSKYIDFLKENKKNEELLLLYADIALASPNKGNMQTLKHFYAEQSPEASFQNYWTAYIHSQGTPVPELKLEFEGETLDLTQARDHWVYIDVWGTWCKPCKRELPGLQAFYESNLLQKDSDLKIYTFSYCSQKLDDFMQEQAYSFPVCEIDKSITEAFHVKGYPTKILITPEGNYIKIPYSADWKMCLKNYIQL